MKRTLIVLVGIAWLALGLPSTWAETIETGQETVITAVYLEGTNLVVVAEVPVGVKRVTLESTKRVSRSAWSPRAVARGISQNGKVTFRLARTADLEILRVRADSSEALPASFFNGQTEYDGQAVNSGTIANGASPGNTFTFPTGALAAPGDTVNRSATRTVTESDIWKIEGNTLYFFNQQRGLQVIDINQPDAAVIKGTLDLPAAGEQMYVLDNGFVALLAQNGCGWQWPPTGNESRVLIVDTTGASSHVPEVAAPFVFASLPVSGSIVESRLVGTALYVASQTYRPVANRNDGSWEWGLQVSSYDLANLPASQPVARQSLWYPGWSGVISATDRLFFLAANGDGGDSVQSTIRLIDISAPDGTLHELGSIRLAGQVNDKFKLNLNGDVFTAISEKWGNWQTAQGLRWGALTRLETFSVSNPSQPAKLGGLELARGEQLHATRFDGDKVYVVTFFRIDPLWIVDLSDPTTPQIKGELQVPGWSTYIQPMGDRLVSIGIDNTNSWRVAVSLFDVHDVSAPALLSKVALGEDSSWSDANADEKAFGFFSDVGLILVPFSSWSTNVQNGVQLIDLNRDSLTKRGVIEQDVQPRRAAVYNDRVLSLTGSELLSVDATDRDKPALKGGLELAWPVDRVLVHGDYLIELSGGASSYGFPQPLFLRGAGGTAIDPASPLLRITLANQPDQMLSLLALTNQPMLGATLQGDRLYIAQGNSTQIIWPPYQDGVTNSPPPVTNAASFVLTVIDVSRLPVASVLGQQQVSLDNQYWGQLEALWPEPGVLVWSGTGNYWNYGGPIVYLDASLGAQTLARPSMTVIANSMIVLPIWRPYYWGGSTGSLIAFDTQDDAAPKYLSQLSLGGTNGWWGFSQAYTANGLIYSSHQATEHLVLGSNVVDNIQTTWVTTTNVVSKTNYTTIPRLTPNLVTVVETNVFRLVANDPFGGSNVSLPGNYARLLAAGSSDSLAVRPDGTLLTWGRNDFGELGDSTFLSRSRFEPVDTLAQVIGVASGIYHSMALTADGAVWSWGNNIFGQAGAVVEASDPDFPPLPGFQVSVPTKILGLASLAQVAAGFNHSLALNGAGNVWVWGGNAYGQFGDGTRTNHTSPSLIPGLSGAALVKSGWWHCFAIKTDGTLWGWGKNKSGQLGMSPGDDQLSPVRVPGLTDVVDVAAGMEHSLALLKDGTVWSWGANDSGQLGDGTLLARPVAAPVAGLPKAVAIASGASHNLALTADGVVWSWGQNDYDQLGADRKASQTVPRPVGALPGIRAITAGRFHNLALSAEGKVWAWGSDLFGELGDGTVQTSTNYTTINQFTIESTNLVVASVVMVTNVTTLAHYETNKIIVPIENWIQRYYLDVVDYSSPTDPVLREPVNIPGTLQGISHDGNVLYTVGAHWTNNASTDWRDWLDALAYDGVAAYSVDSVRLSESWPHPVTLHGSNLLIGNPSNGKSTNELQVWTLNLTGKLTQLGAVEVPSAVQNLNIFGDMLAAQLSDSVSLFDLRIPGTPTRLGGGGPGGCVGYDLTHADGVLAGGLWIPLGTYGVVHIDVSNASP